MLTEQRPGGYLEEEGSDTGNSLHKGPWASIPGRRPYDSLTWHAVSVLQPARVEAFIEKKAIWDFLVDKHVFKTKALNSTPPQHTQFGEHCVRYHSVHWKPEDEGRDLAFSGAVEERKTEKVEEECGVRGEDALAAAV